MRHRKDLAQNLNIAEENYIFHKLNIFMFFRAADENPFVPLLTKLSQTLPPIITKESHEENERLLCILSETLISLMRIQEKEAYYKDVPVSVIATLLKHHPKNVNVLRMAAVYFHQGKGR